MQSRKMYFVHVYVNGTLLLDTVIIYNVIDFSCYRTASANTVIVKIFSRGKTGVLLQFWRPIT